MDVINSTPSKLSDVLSSASGSSATKPSIATEKTNIRPSSESTSSSSALSSANPGLSSDQSHQKTDVAHHEAGLISSTPSTTSKSEKVGFTQSPKREELERTASAPDANKDVLDAFDKFDHPLSTRENDEEEQKTPSKDEKFAVQNLSSENGERSELPVSESLKHSEPLSTEDDGFGDWDSDFATESSKSVNAAPFATGDLPPDDDWDSDPWTSSQPKDTKEDSSAPLSALEIEEKDPISAFAAQDDGHGGWDDSDAFGTANDQQLLTEVFTPPVNEENPFEEGTFEPVSQPPVHSVEHVTEDTGLKINATHQMEEIESPSADPVDEKNDTSPIFDETPAEHPLPSGTPVSMEDVSLDTKDGDNQLQISNEPEESQETTEKEQNFKSSPDVVVEDVEASIPENALTQFIESENPLITSSNVPSETEEDMGTPQTTSEPPVTESLPLETSQNDSIDEEKKESDLPAPQTTLEDVEKANDSATNEQAPITPSTPTLPPSSPDKTVTQPSSESNETESATETITEATKSATNAGDASDQVRHLSSKLDVLTRVLEERERQLTARSSTMADLQNENERVKRELELFSSAHAKASSGASADFLEALKQEFSERIGTMETKFRSTLKEKEKLAEQLRVSKLQLDATTAQVDAMRSELDVFRSGGTPLPQASASVAAPIPSTPSRFLGQILPNSPFATSSAASGAQSNSSLVDSALSSISSLLSPSQPAADARARNSVGSERTSPATPGDSMLRSPSAPDFDQGDITPRTEGSPNPSVASSARSLEDELRAEGTALQEKVQRYEGVIRELRSREKSRVAEISRLEAKLASTNAELQSEREEKLAAKLEAERARDSEKKTKIDMEAQKGALDLTVKQLEEKTTTSGAIEREGAGLKAELESSWRLNESLKKELEELKEQGENDKRALEERYKAQNLESSAALIAKSSQAQSLLQNTISELRTALDGKTTIKSAQEEAMEARIADLESALSAAEQHLTMARQTSDLAHTPLLKQISELQAQLSHQQRTIEAVEDAWKSRAQALETSLATANHDLQQAHSQQRAIEQSLAKIQHQYARLEHSHQTLQIEYDQAIIDVGENETERETLNKMVESLQSNNNALNAKLASQTIRLEESAAEHKEVVSKLQAQISQLNQRIASFTTPGFASSSTYQTVDGMSIPLPRNLSSVANIGTPGGLNLSPPPSLDSSGHVLPPLASPAAAQTPQKAAHTTSALETQLALLRSEKSKLEDMLAQSLQISSQSEELAERLRISKDEQEKLQERLNTSLELVAEQSERLQYVDEEIAETKELYKAEIANLVARLEAMTQRIKELESK